MREGTLRVQLGTAGEEASKPRASFSSRMLQRAYTAIRLKNLGTQGHGAVPYFRLRPVIIVSGRLRDANEWRCVCFTKVL